ncbi:hypothetical protein JNW88_21360, partial [Micromonospora sp. ATA32]|nr:hypothetical protein [Micromonospora sp. ATA32]
MRRGEQRPDLPDAPGAQQRHGVQHPLVLGDHVPDAASGLIAVQPVQRGVQPVGRHVAQGGDAEHRAARSQALRREAYSPSACRCGARLSMTRTVSPAPSRSNGICSTDSERQSRKSACPARQRITADWSMMPV